MKGLTVPCPPKQQKPSAAHLARLIDRVQHKILDDSENLSRSPLQERKRTHNFCPSFGGSTAGFASMTSSTIELGRTPPLRIDKLRQHIRSSSRSSLTSRHLQKAPASLVSLHEAEERSRKVYERQVAQRHQKERWVQD